MLLKKKKFEGDWLGNYPSLNHLLRGEEHVHEAMNLSFLSLTNRIPTEENVQLTSVLIADNFCMDTLPENDTLLSSIFEESKNMGREVFMVLLNPFSSAAEQRNASLAETEKAEKKEIFNLPQRVNRGLRNIINNMERQDWVYSPDFMAKEKDYEYIFEQLETIKNLTKKHNYNFILRHNDIINYPSYIFLCHCFKGNFHLGRSSRFSSWYHYINTPFEDDYQDMYNGFQALFDSSFELTKENARQRLKDEQAELANRMLKF